MRKTTFLFVFVLLLVMVSSASAHRGVRHFTVDLDPLNNSGVDGTAYLSLDGDSLTVTIHATGLEPNRVHPQHIHGHEKPVTQNNGNATCPTSAADVNGDGLVDVGEGVPNYGPVQLVLAPFSTTPDGTLHYSQTFTDLSGLEPVNTLQTNAIVLHGMSVNGVYSPSLPIACGQINPAPNGP